MKRSKVTLATLAAVGFLIPLVGVSLNRQTQARGISDASKSSQTAESRRFDPPTTFKESLYAPQARWIWEGVMAPLNSLPVMQRAIAAASTSDAIAVPTLAILNEPLKTTGLGPIRIGMPIKEVSKTGLALTPVEGSSSSECQYYRIDDHAEPIGLMAVDDRILRIDVWPGSLTTALSGAKIGTTEQELVQYYGQERLEATFNANTDGKTIVFTPKDPGEDIYRLVFETDERGRVVQYRAGQFPSVTWPEGCL
jgi:hypothetical protein